MSVFRMVCGCEFNLIDGKIDLDLYHTPDCPGVWEYLAEGKTKGIFQLEDSGRRWVKEIKPENMDHLSALGALLRPGCLKVKDEKGITTTQHYALRKNMEEEVEYFPIQAEDILKESYGLTIYQEQSIKLVQVFAGFNLAEADLMRKALGKKDSKLLSSLKSKFIDGCKRVGILSDEEATKLFEQIKAGERYSFNKSHSYGYGGTTYETAYQKYHFPLHFFTSALRWAHEDQSPEQEIREIIIDARLHHINVYPPDIRDLEEEFYIKNDEIYFGLTNIKGIGAKKVAPIIKRFKEFEEIYSLPFKDWEWEHLLFSCNSASVMELFIKAGACRYGMSRREMLFQLEIWGQLTKTQYKVAMDIFLEYGRDSLLNILMQIYDKKLTLSNQLPKIKSLIQQLQSPPYSLIDEPYIVANMEKELLGLPLTCTKTDKKDVEPTAYCIDFLDKNVNSGTFAVEVTYVNSFKIKNGQNKGKSMAKVAINDLTGQIENCVVFNKEWEKLNHLFIEGNILLVQGEKSYKDDALIIKNAWQI